MSSHMGHSPPDHEPASPSTAVTTPEHSANSEDDIWGESEPPTGNIPPGDELLSDLPTIKRLHMTDGYREGLAIGKAKVMQQGFDAGYPIGVQVALRAGVVLGVLEGRLAAFKSASQAAERISALQKLYKQAQEELSCSALLKGADDELIANATTVPPFIDEVISKWEISVLGTAKDNKRREESN